MIGYKSLPLLFIQKVHSRFFYQHIFRTNLKQKIAPKNKHAADAIKSMYLVNVSALLLIKIFSFILFSFLKSKSAAEVNHTRHNKSRMHNKFD